MDYIAIGACLLLPLVLLFSWLLLSLRGTSNASGRGESDRRAELQLEKKFIPKDGGITFYDNAMSPCARRVRLTLRAKGIEHSVVWVDLVTRENRHPSYLAINPQGKVPALVVRNVEGIPDCCLYESNAITEWLDEQFPETVQLYPSDPWERAQVKMWQRWEMAMAEDFWPLMYANVMGFLIRMLYSREAYRKRQLREAGGSEYQLSKMMKTFDGELLSEREMRRNAVRLFRWLDVLEARLKGRAYVSCDRLTTADISVVPRTMLYPVIGLLVSKEERSRFPNVMRYLKHVTHKPPFDSRGGVSPSAWLKWIPYSLVEWIGNFRSGKNLRHVYGRDVIRSLDAIIKNPQGNEERFAGVVPSGFDVVMYRHTAWPEAMAVHIACAELGVRAEVIDVDMMQLRHKSPSYLQVNPYGEVPAIVHQGHCVYDPKNIMEYLDSCFSSGAHPSLLPKHPTDRVFVRMWEGWISVCFNYQLVHLYKHYVVAPILKLQFSSKQELLDALHKSTKAAECVDDYIQLYETDTMEDGEIESKLQPYKQGVHESLRYLEGRLQGSANFLVASRLTLADIFVSATLWLCPYVGISLEGARGTGSDDETKGRDVLYPNIARWQKSLLARPAFGEAYRQLGDYMKQHGIAKT